MAEVIWTEQALEDLGAICLFIGRDSPHYARVFANDVFLAIDRLAAFPASGRVVPELKKADIREILLGNYRIIYRNASEKVQILTVHHGARLLGRDDLQSASF